MSPSNGRNTHSKRLMAAKGTEPPKACKCPFATISHHPKNPDPETMETSNPPKVTPRFRASKQVQLDTPTPNILRILIGQMNFRLPKTSRDTQNERLVQKASLVEHLGRF